MDYAIFAKSDFGVKGGDTARYFRKVIFSNKQNQFSQELISFIFCFSTILLWRLVPRFLMTNLAVMLLLKIVITISINAHFC